MMIVNELKNNSRVFGLDLVRAVAIIIVLLGHSSELLENTKLSGFPYLHLIDGVELFFVLSGYLIGSLLLKQIAIIQSFDIRMLLNFWKRRWFRTLPNYYLILIVNILLFISGAIKGNQAAINLKFFLFLQNFNKPFLDFFWESWSLSVEEWFYLIFGCMLFILHRLFNSMYAYLFSAIALILFSLIYRIYNSHLTVDYFWWDVTFRKVVLCRLDGIGFGTLFAYIHFYYPQLWNKIKKSCLVLGLILFFSIPYITVYPNLFFFKTFYFTITAISCVLCIPYFSTLNVKPTYTSKIITYISLISYSLYLINLSIVLQLIKNYSSFNGYINYSLFWIINFITATFLYVYYEKPIMDLRDNL